MKAALHTLCYTAKVGEACVGVIVSQAARKMSLMRSLREKSSEGVVPQEGTASGVRVTLGKFSKTCKPKLTIGCPEFEFAINDTTVFSYCCKPLTFRLRQTGKRFEVRKPYGNF